MRDNRRKSRLSCKPKIILFIAARYHAWDTIKPSGAHCPSTRSTDLADPASGSPLRRTGPSGHQTIQTKAHREDDPPTPKPRLSDRGAESSTQPRTSAVIFRACGCTKRCTKTSQRIPMSPTVADYRTSNLLILLMPAVDRPPVTAEVASSSLVVPAILSKGVIGRDTENSNPQLNPQLLVHRRTHPHGC